MDKLPVLDPSLSINEKIFVALDLETTGLDVQSEEIIEIGIVKFQGTNPIDYYSSFVRPHRSIPWIVQQMTGIDDDLVKSAPLFPTLASKIISFIAHHPIIGHNIGFDLSFLEKNGLLFDNSTVDTFEMAQIALPTAFDYSLSGLMQQEQLPVATSHRALDDAISAASLFVHLRKRISKLSFGAQSALHDIFSRTVWDLGQFILPKRIHFSESETSLSVPYSSSAIHIKIPSPNELKDNSTEQICVDPNSMQSLMLSDGTLARKLTGFEVRSQQVEMLYSICDSFNQKSHLLLEGATGSGKTLAYLLSAVRFSQLSDSPVVVSTHTLSLQDQLIRKDIPDLIEALEDEDWFDRSNFRFSVFKGKSNYLCRHRWGQLASSKQLTKDEAKVLIKTLVWSNETATGDREEINLIGQDNEIWHKISVQNPLTCPYAQQDQCYYKSAQSKRDAAELIVVNHSLLAADLNTGAGLLPDYDYLVIDEAHHLEDDVTRELGFTAEFSQLGDKLAILQRNLGLSHDTGNESASSKSPYGMSDTESRRISEDFSLAHTEIRDFDNVITGFMASVMHKERYAQLRIDKNLRETASWTKVSISADRVCHSLAGLLHRVSSYTDRWQSKPSASETGDRFKNECVQSALDLEEILRKLREFIFEPLDENVYWMSSETRNRILRFNIAPIEVSSFLEEKLFSGDKAVVLTSATMQTDKGFTYIRNRLGLMKANEKIVQSSFDYESQALCLVANDTPFPTEPTYIGVLGKTVVEVAEVLGGHVLVLCTAHGMIRSIRQSIAEPLAAVNIRVMAQNIDGSPARLIRSIRNDHAGVLLGAASFWEGVDIGQNAIKAIIIARLPFEPPGDPLFEAKSESHEDPFKDFALPQAVLKFRQGFGRLIRSKDDKGVVIVMDSRVHLKRYGSIFLNALPDCSKEFLNAREISGKVSDWLIP